MNHRVLIHYYVRTWKRICFRDNANDRALTRASRYVCAMCAWLSKRHIQNDDWTAESILCIRIFKVLISHNRSESIPSGIKMQTTNLTSVKKPVVYVKAKVPVDQELLKKQ